MVVITSSNGKAFLQQRREGFSDLIGWWMAPNLGQIMKESPYRQQKDETGSKVHLPAETYQEHKAKTTVE